MKVTNPADIVRYTLAHYKKDQPVWPDTLNNKPPFTQPQNKGPAIELNDRYENPGNPAPINVTIDGKSKDKQTIFADKQAPFRKKPFLPKA